MNITRSVANPLFSFIGAILITGLGFVMGGWNAVSQGPLQADIAGVAVMEHSFLIVIAIQFALTGIITAFTLRGQGLSGEVLALLMIPFLIYWLRYSLGEMIVAVCYGLNWLVLWRVLVLRSQAKIKEVLMNHTPEHIQRNRWLEMMIILILVFLAFMTVGTYGGWVEGKWYWWGIGLLAWTGIIWGIRQLSRITGTVGLGI